MKNLNNVIEELFKLIQFKEFRVDCDNENKKVSLYINDDVLDEKSILNLRIALDRLLKLIAKKYDEGPITVDLNNYFRDRERMILDLARAGAKKASLLKEDVPLPAMNAFERRLVHNELMTRPDVKTESVGEGENRKIIIKYVS